MGKASLWTSCLYIRNGKLDTKWRCRKTKSRKEKSRTALDVLFQKRVRVFRRGFKHEKTDESTRPAALCFYCFRVFETSMKHKARVFEITSPTKEN